MIKRRLTYCIIMAGLLGSLVCVGEQKPKVPPMVEYLRQLSSASSDEDAQYRPVTQSNFEKIEALFKAGKRPSLKAIKSEALLSGKCVRRDGLGQFTRSLMSTYKVEKNAKKEMYFIPVFEKAPNSSEFDELLKDPQKFFKQKRKEIKYYKPTEENFPTEVPLGDLFTEKLRNSLSIIYDRKPDASTPPHLVGLAYFQLRVGHSPDGKIITLLSQLCPFVRGCAVPIQNKMLILPYADPLAYCYYNEKINWNER